MNNKQQPKVRLVKCPRCSKLLPEPEHVPLYSCGGCGTTLKAKYYKGHLKDITSSSHGRDVTRSNVMIHVRSSGESGSSSRRSSYSGEHAASQENGRDKDASDSGTEQNKAVNSSYDTSSSNETNSLKNKENGVIDNKLNHFDSKDIYKGRDENTVTSCTNAEQNGAASSSHHTALSEESGFTVKKESGEIDKEIDQFNSKDQVSNGFLTVLEKKESELHTMAGSATTDLNGQDEWHNDIAVDDHQQKQIGAVNNGSEKCTIEDSQVPEKKEMQHLSMVRETVEDEGDLHEQKQIGYAAFSSLTESSGTTNLAEHDASVSVVSKKMRKMHLGGEHFHQDKDEQKQKECVNSSEDASSMNVSSAIKDSVGPDVSDRESSEEIREMHLAGEHPHQDRHEHNQVGYVNSDKVISSLSESSAIKNSTAYPNHEASEETRIVHLEEQHMHQDQDEQKQTEYVNPSKGVSSLAVSSAIMSPGEPDAAEHEVSKETRELHLAETHIHQDRHERKQAGYMNSAKGAFSLSESSAIKNQSEYLNHEVSKETRDIHLVRECSHQGQHEYVNSPNIISSLTVPSAIETSTGPDASDHEVFEKTSKRHIVGNDFQQDQNEKKQDPAESTSSLTEYVAIEKVTQLAFNNMEEDASYCEVPDETRKKLLSDKHSQQDNLRSDIHHFNVNEPKEVEYSGKEFGNGRDSNNLVECIMEQDGNVKLSSEASLSTEITQGGNDCVSASSSAKNLKTSQEIGQTNSSMDPRKEFISDNGKRTSKENVKKFENMAVYTDTEVGSPLKEVPRYPTKRSPAYDGSVSSFDGNDDQVAEQPAQVDGETSSPINANAGYDGAEESPEWTNNMSERMMYRRYSRVEAQAKNSSSVQFEKKLKSSMVEEGGIREEYEIPQKITDIGQLETAFCLGFQTIGEVLN
ncbi:Protein ENHANCED DISEASE RESISTANCE 4 [Bienertia sinuspersici]